MTKADAARLVAIVVTAYPNFDKFKDAKAIEATVNLWAMMFEQDESGIVALAVKKHIATNKWPPSVAEVREIMLEIQHPELIEPDKAWLAVSDLMYSAGQFNHGDLSHQLPPLVARAVESIGWTSLWEMHRSAYIGGKSSQKRGRDSVRIWPVRLTCSARTGCSSTQSAPETCNGTRLRSLPFRT